MRVLVPVADRGSTPRSAAELLAEFKQTGLQAPFEEIVRRYGGMVFGVCYRVTQNVHDAEDATQAVFLALAVMGKTERPIRAIGPWLQQVAHRVSLDIKRSKKRRNAREEKHRAMMEVHHRGNGDDNGHRAGAVHPLDMDEVKKLLAEELGELPAKYRLPMILHYYGDLSREEMAAELKCSANTLGVRLHRARAMLSKRLAKRGVTLAGGMLAVVLTEIVRTVVTDTLLGSTARAATHAASTSGVLQSAAVSAEVLGLAQGAARRAFTAKVRLLTAIGLVCATGMGATAQAVAKAWPGEFPLPLPSLERIIRPILGPLFRPAQVQVIPEVAPESTTNEQRERSRTFDTLAERRRIEDAAIESMPPLSPPRPSAPWIQPSAIPIEPTRIVIAPSIASPTPVPREPATDAQPRRVAIANASQANGPIAKHSPERLSPPRRGQLASAAPVQKETHALAGVPALLRSDSQHSNRGANLIASRPSPPLIKPPPVSPPPAPQPAVSPPPPAPPPPSAPIDLALRPASWNGNSPGVKPTLSPLSNPAGQVSTMSYAIHDGVTGSSHSVALDTQVMLTASLRQALGMAASDEITITSTNAPAAPPAAPPSIRLGLDSVQGWGSLNVTGTLTQDGQVIADGGGVDRTLDLSGVGAIVSTIENPTVHGSNGWYAANHGKLTLPAIRVPEQGGSFNWAEDPSDIVPDLVNSVRFTVAGTTESRVMQLALVAADRGDAPPAIAGRNFLALWSVDGEPTQTQLVLRYDDTAAALLQVSESSLELWQFESSWRPVPITTFSLDTTQHLISGTIDSVSHFAVVTPEPGTSALVAVGAASMLMRRRRRT